MTNRATCRQSASGLILVIGAAEHGGIAAAVIILVEIEVNLLKLNIDIEIG